MFHDLLVTSVLGIDKENGGRHTTYLLSQTLGKEKVFFFLLRLSLVSRSPEPPKKVELINPV